VLDSSGEMFGRADLNNNTYDLTILNILLIVNLATDTEVDTLFYSICLRGIDLKPHIFIR
jgi:hypothetical protein